MIPYGRHEINEGDILAVLEVLKSDFLTQGPTVPLFETSVASYCGANHAVAVNSATSALHIACLALGLGPGDWLWTTPNTFVASANCALYCGAQVDFVDINPKTYNMCSDALELKLKSSEKQGRLPKIVIPVHFAGQPCDMIEIQKLSEKYGFRIIEDASHAIGASYQVATNELGGNKKIKVGSCNHSDITVFSFHPVKIITTGEGGVATTNDSLLAEKMSRLRSHGVTQDRKAMEQRPGDEIWNYQQIDLGFNYRMTDIQAALGLSQLKRLDEYLVARHSIAKNYDSMLVKLPITTPWQRPGTYSSYHLYPISLNLDSTHASQMLLYKELIAKGIAVNLHYIPVHRHPFFEKLGFKSGDFPNAESHHKKSITLPIFPTLTEEDQSLVFKSLTDFFASS